MPLRWKILHAEKLVHVIAEGPVTLKHMEEHFDAIVTANALSYSKLFDATRLEPVYDDHDVMMLGARLSAYTSNFDSGPPAPGSRRSLSQSSPDLRGAALTQLPARLARDRVGAPESS